MKKPQTAKAERRVLARIVADELDLVSGGTCTGTHTSGVRPDYTNLAGDNDGCDPPPP